MTTKKIPPSSTLEYKRAYKRRYYRKHHKKVLAYQRAYQPSYKQDNPKIIQKATKKFLRKNPEYMRAYYLKHRQHILKMVKNNRLKSL